jgi:hypothetical protein
MTLKLQYPFTLIVAGPSSCGKSIFVIRLLDCREQVCDIVFTNIALCHSENNVPPHVKNVTFVKGVPDYENPENLTTLIVLDDLMVSAYSTKVSQLFNSGSNHRNIGLVLITVWSQLHFLHVLIDAKPRYICALFTSADDGLIKAIVECDINKLNGNHKLTKEDTCK